MILNKTAWTPATSYLRLQAHKAGTSLKEAYINQLTLAGSLNYVYILKQRLT